MINELKSGQLQAVVLEKAIAEGYIAQNDDLTLANFNLKSDGTDAYAVNNVRVQMTCLKKSMPSSKRLRTLENLTNG